MAPDPMKAPATVGLEVHVRLQTPTKLFCRCPNRFGDAADMHVCPVCLGLPGALPVVAPAAVDQAVRLALGLGCRIRGASVFARKHYFYPDLPRNYQITQHERPLATGGVVDEAGVPVRIRRVHLEEDAGRSRHGADGATEVDLDRAGAPLAEIVTEPDLTSGREARNWLVALRRRLLFLGVTDGRMQAGSLRCDGNVGFADTGPVTELKNLNSFRALARAVDQEIQRLGRLRAAEEPLPRGTRGWDEKVGGSVALRSKESVPDYRYLTEPDLPVLRVPKAQVEALLEGLPATPDRRRRELSATWGLSEEVAEELCRDPRLTAYVEDVFVRMEEGTTSPDHQTGAWTVRAAAWIRTEVLGHGDDGEGGFRAPLPSNHLAELLLLLVGGRITGSVAREILGRILAGDERSPGRMVRDDDLAILDDPELLADICRRALASHPAEAGAWRGGRNVLAEFFVGRVMASSGGRALPADVRRCLLEALRETLPEE